MSKVTTNTEWCKSCGFCITQCPKEAISMTQKMNTKGYSVVQINQEICIACGFCYWVCPDSVFEMEG